VPGKHRVKGGGQRSGPRRRNAEATHEDEYEARCARAAHTRQTKIAFKAKRAASAAAAAETLKRRKTEADTTEADTTEAAHTLVDFAAPPPPPTLPSSPTTDVIGPTDTSFADGETPTTAPPTDDDETSPLA